MWFQLAYKSLLNRKFSVALTLIGLLISVSLLFAIEHIRVQTKDNFKRTVSGVDLVVAARSSQINVLLSSVFRLGANPNSVSWQTYEYVSAHKNVVWSIPLSLGDAYKGYPVVGTTSDYFSYYKYGKKQALTLTKGRFFARPNELVVGANLAKNEHLKIGSQIVISHGSGKVSFSQHSAHPFVVSGILAATGTPVDKSLHVPLVAIEAMHKPQLVQSSFTKPNEHNNKEEHAHDDTHSIKPLESAPEIDYDLVGEPKNISAFLLKTDSPFAILTLQRDLNRYEGEAISAIIPGLALAELWQMLGTIEVVLQLISMLVLVASLIGLSTMMLASMHERQSEIAVLRAIGASPLFIASLIQAEALLIAIVAIIGGFLLVTIGLFGLNDYLLSEYGVFVSYQIVSVGTLQYAGIMLVLTFLVAMLPTLMAYKGAKNLFH